MITTNKFNTVVTFTCYLSETDRELLYFFFKFYLHKAQVPSFLPAGKVASIFAFDAEECKLP